MKHEILKKVIDDQHHAISNCVIFDRPYVLQDNVNYILVGLRRAGKSTMLYKKVLDLIASGVEWNQIIYINFEDERLLEFTTSDFDDIVQVKNELTDKKGFFFFDEIQNIDYWDKFVRRLADAHETVYVTGSNSKMLSNEMNASLGGRFVTKFIMPFSFKEYLNALNQKRDYSTKSKASLINCTKEFLTNGGLPASLFLTDKKEYIVGVFEKLLLNDVLLHNKIRSENAMRILIKKIAETVKDEISFTKLHNILKSIGFSLSKDVIIDYVGYLKNSNLIFEIKNYYASFVDKESMPKYYFMDNGILNLFLFDKETRLLENAVATYLKREGHDFYYLKSLQTGIDIDFYIPDTNTLIQVSHSMQNLETRKRELSSFIKWSDASSNLIVVTYDEKETINIENKTINVVPIYDFLEK